jgi:hypothetical protein
VARSHVAAVTPYRGSHDMPMDFLVTLGRTLGFSLTAGVNLYATVAILGLAARNDWFELPPQYEAFATDWVIGTALALYVIEFIADKIPWVDSLWDSVHTVIRPVGGAVVAVATLGEQTPTVEALVALLGGALAAGSHLTKASTRVAANATPEPFSNWVLSFVEDAFVIGLGLVALKYPLAALAITLLIVVMIVLALRWIVGKLRVWWQRPAPTL